MKILLIASGGDGSGMNKVIAEIYKKFKSNSYACFAGFRGLYKNNISPLSAFEPLKHQNEAGCCIKTARFPEFKEEEYFKIAL
jgi:6-phosphofructokinase 1